MEEDQEGSPIIVDPNDEPMTDDNFILSDGATSAQDESEAENRKWMQPTLNPS